MIPGAALDGIVGGLKLARRLWWAFPMLGLGVALLITRATLADARADFAAYELGMTKAAAAQTALTLERERKSAAVNQEIDRAHQSNMAGLRTAYDQRLRDLTGKPDATVPSVPDPASGFTGSACGDGLLSISAETAVALMKTADENTMKLLNLQAWVNKQGAIQ